MVLRIFAIHIFLVFSIMGCVAQIGVDHIKNLANTPQFESKNLIFKSISENTQPIYQETHLKQPSFLMNNYIDELPLFCKIEVLSDVKTKIPIRIRLGSLQYVDRLENKYQGYEWIRSNRYRERL